MPTRSDLVALLTPIASWLAARDGYSFSTELGEHERGQYLDEAARLAEAASLPLASRAESASLERVEPFRRLVALTEELCDAVDNAGDDVGGSRGSLTILREIGPAVEVAKRALPLTEEAAS